MSVTPLVLYHVFLDEGQSFNVHEASSATLTGMVRSRFIGREAGLLILESRFQDLADRSVIKQLKSHRLGLEDFTRSRMCDFVLVINTHASPNDGGLLYGKRKTTSLEVIVSHILGEFGSPAAMASRFRRTMLVVLSCGGFVQHSLSEMRSMSRSFTAVLAFGAAVLDPILVMGQFVTSTVDYYVMGQEELWTAIYRSLKQEIMQHTSIYVGCGSTIHKIVDASWRRRPNGEDVRCCQQAAKYIKTDRSGRITFRCREPEHQGTRTFRVEPLPALLGVRWFLGKRGGSRYMISVVQ
ncbi:hypothetical protein C8T65DRAFT_592892 [Cerioporus squamosus]|nr:hypothetical protein C8T65DRAFT_592892 [Cerioporus squamosus]